MLTLGIRYNIHRIRIRCFKDSDMGDIFLELEKVKIHRILQNGTAVSQITLDDETIPADRVKAVAELTGLDDVIESSENGYDTKCTPELFSRGQWQLLSIARAAVAEPQMLLFDEITANLDAETEKAVLLALKRVAKDRTVISISHRTSAELGRIIYL